MAEQRAHDDAQHTKVVRLLVERDEQTRVEKLELEAHRKELEAKLEEQRQSYEAKLEAHRKELEAQRQSSEKRLETKLEAQRKEFEMQRQAYETQLEAQRKDLEGKSEAHRLEGQARTNKVTALQLRFEALGESKLLEDEELSAIEDKVADAVGAAATEDGADGAWECVMHMVRLSEGIASEKTFARQLRRKFL